MTWHPLANRVEAPKDGGTFLTGVGWKSVIHTTEVLTYRPSEKDYYGHQSWPHATIAGGVIHQHIPINRAARALKNVAGGVETNRARAVQVEVCAKAAEIHRLPADQRKALADWLVWVHQQTGAPLTSPPFVGAEKSPARVNAPQRFSHTDWLTYSGICGHQHVPENTHWDPGALNLDAVLAFAQEDFMAALSDKEQRELYERVMAMDDNANMRMLAVLNDLKRFGGELLGPEGRLTSIMAAIRRQPWWDKTKDV